jgi:hypothetical protein
MVRMQGALYIADKILMLLKIDAVDIFRYSRTTMVGNKDSDEDEG